ncbi:hypothetical protein PENTCL1PPCAC_85, partial [Pristionchus entomophagus]
LVQYTPAFQLAQIDMDLLEKLAFLEIPLTINDLNKPEPAIVQRLYRSLLVKCFGIPELSLSQPDFKWVTADMQNDPDLFNRSESFILVTRIIQSILNDYTNLSEDSPQFGIGALIDPKPRETKQYLNQLVTIAKLKQASRQYYVDEEARIQAQINEADELEARAIEMEKRLARLKAERAARLGLDKQLHETKEKREARVHELNRAAEQKEQATDQMTEQLARMITAQASKEQEQAALKRKASELDYDIIEDPEMLKNEVEELRVRKVDQRSVLNNETRECGELEKREEKCREAERQMGSFEGDLSAAAKMVGRLDLAVREMNEKKAVLDEKTELLKSKKDGVENKREEREVFRQRHEEEKREMKKRLETLAGQIADVRAECERLKSEEGAVKKSVTEARQKLTRLRNEKNTMVSEMTSYTQLRMCLLQQLEAKMAEKQTFLRTLESAYNEGKENLENAMTTTDLDVSVTTTQTMQLLD